MGFSVSGSAVVILTGLLISFGMFFTAASNGNERVADAQSAALDDNRAVQNSGVNVTEATWDGASNELTVHVNNTGTVDYTLQDTDIVVDNDLQTSFVSRTVDGDANTDLWLPGNQLTVVVSLTVGPSRVKVVTETGVADAEVV